MIKQPLIRNRSIKPKSIPLYSFPCKAKSSFILFIKQFQKMILVTITLFSFYKSGGQDTLYWSPHYKLTWNDFKGKTDKTRKNYAITSSGISYSFHHTDTTFTYQAVAFFDRKKSWKKGTAHKNILEHEQGHFDITEIFARKLKNQLKEVQPKRKTVEAVVTRIAEKIISEKNDYQKKYDLETSFGMNSEAQKKWELIIKKQLGL